MSSLRRHGLLFVSLVNLVACSAKPENAPSGSCSLSCSGARVAAAEFQLEALTPPAFTLACKNPGDPLTAPLTIRYRVSQRPTTNFNQKRGENADAAAGGAGGAATIPTEPQVNAVPTVPVGAVGFDPIVYGDMAFSKTAGEFKNANNEVNPVRYAGVVTPPSEWCSDSCGIMTYEIWPNCAEGSVTTGVQAGAVKSGGFVTISITVP
ncbi:MAG: hypothetical protein FJ146_08900 [Deltaproteobacteria bacterium]|nr:hypothetical protein [Deltaproteobacteria bacterium]